MKKCKSALLMKIFLISIIVILSFTVGVYANDIIKTITAQLRPDFTIVIDNEKQIFKDADGKTVYPLLYEGTTYLPVRSIGNIMGKNVDWDENKKLVSLSNPLNEKKSIYVNGKLTELDQVHLQDNYYVNIAELKSELNNLEFEKDANGNLHIFERTGLGVINKEGEEYIDFTLIANRYSGKNSHLLPVEWLYNQSEPSFLKRMHDNTLVSEGPRAQFISINNYFYNGWFYKKADFQEFTGEFLDIIKSNENYIAENPDVLKDNDNAVTVWEDKNFEAIMRYYLNNFDKDIYVKDLNDITELNINSNWKIETNIKECEIPEEYQNKIGFITSMKDIDNFNNLNEIAIYGNKIDSIHTYKNSSNISSLNLSSNKLQNLSGIENYSNLTNLDISDNYIEDLKPLNNLSKLKTLDLSFVGPPAGNGNRNYISNIDINTISELKNLESIIIQNSNISNISTLNKFNYLKSLHLWKCNLNIDELYLISDNNENMIENLAFDEISNISGEPAVLDMSKFKNLNNLKYLYVSGKLTNINSLNNLNSLDMVNNYISESESFSNLKNLEWLKILNSKFEDPKVLEDLNKLETVYFSDTDISSLKHLKNNKNLKSLWIVNGSLSDISDLKEFTNLENMMLPNNDITDISVLSELHNLKRINISDNPIKDYTVINNLKNKEKIQIIK